MKKSIYVAIIIVMAVITVNCLNAITDFCYDIPDNIVETYDFRNMNINEKAIADIEKISKKEKINMSKSLASVFVKSKLKISTNNLTGKEIVQLNNKYKNADYREYSKVCNAIAAIFSDLKYFPVAKSDTSKYWVCYEDSFGAKRSYNGNYKHEGTDLMGEKNISGYYPIISVTDGVVENIGWLEKGGYRVGIRSQSGGYFYYAHLSSYSNIKKGDKIKAGTLLGYMGDTGYGKEEGISGKFDVHLHFGIYIKTDNYEELSINPYHILKYLENKLIIANY